MDNEYRKERENIYYRCRLEAAEYNEKLRSRDGASEQLGCSPSTLAKYELGITKVVPPEAVIMMADLYKAPELKAYYCANECPLGQGSPIATEIKTLDRITVEIMKTLSPKKVEEAKEKLLAIAEDGIISDDELPVLAELVGFLDSTTKRLGELRLLAEKYLPGGVPSADGG